MNPREHCKVVTLRSGLQYEGPEMPEEAYLKPKETKQLKSSSHRDAKISHKKDATTDKDKDTQRDKPRYVPPSPLKPAVLFPKMLVKSKQEKEFNKFLEIIKKLHITIPFTM
jgi:hypothetical protein